MSVSDSELLVLKCIWDAGRALSVAEIMSRLKLKYSRDYKHSTVCTFLTRLKEKKYVDYTVHGKRYLYFPMVSETNYLNEEIEHFQSFWFNDSFPDLLKAFSKHHTFTAKELKELRALSENISEQAAAQTE